jgi:hypothetical protein
MAIIITPKPENSSTTTSNYNIQTSSPLKLK